MIPQNHDTLLSCLKIHVKTRDILFLTHIVRALETEPPMGLQILIIHHIAIYIGLRTNYVYLNSILRRTHIYLKRDFKNNIL